MDKIQLTDLSQLDAIASPENSKISVIFKHSTSCGISAMVLRRFENGLEDLQGKIDYYFLDLLRYRPISNEVASRFQVRHESPQLLVIQNGVVIHHSSHSQIDISAIKKELG